MVRCHSPGKKKIVASRFACPTVHGIAEQYTCHTLPHADNAGRARPHGPHERRTTRAAAAPARALRDRQPSIGQASPALRGRPWPHADRTGAPHHTAPPATSRRGRRRRSLSRKGAIRPGGSDGSRRARAATAAQLDAALAVTARRVAHGGTLASERRERSGHRHAACVPPDIDPCPRAHGGRPATTASMAFARLGFAGAGR